MKNYLDVCLNLQMHQLINRGDGLEPRTETEESRRRNATVAREKEICRRQRRGGWCNKSIGGGVVRMKWNLVWKSWDWRKKKVVE